MRALTILVIAGLVAASTADAQQVLQVDYTTGRTIIDDEWRHINPDHLAVDRMSGVNNRVSLHPLRRISGEPCPGMLPSVK